MERKPDKTPKLIFVFLALAALFPFCGILMLNSNWNCVDLVCDTLSFSDDEGNYISIADGDSIFYQIDVDKDKDGGGENDRRNKER